MGWGGMRGAGQARLGAADIEKARFLPKNGKKDGKKQVFFLKTGRKQNFFLGTGRKDGKKTKKMCDAGTGRKTGRKQQFLPKNEKKAKFLPRIGKKGSKVPAARVMAASVADFRQVV